MRTFYNQYIILLLLSSAALDLVNSIFLDSSSHHNKNNISPKNPAWNDLKVTWGFNVFSPDVFVSMPRTETDAIRLGWTREKSCPQVNGNRYMFRSDRAVLLNFNANGIHIYLSIR
jgi:hypothetical protein